MLACDGKHCFGLGDFNTLTKYIVLGIWEVLDSQEVVSFIHQEIRAKHDLRTAIQKLMDACLSDEAKKLGCDNMTVIIIAFFNHRSSKDWYHWIARQDETQKDGI